MITNPKSKAVSILDANRNTGTTEGLSPADQQLYGRRRNVIGAAAPLLYDTPVHVVSGNGAWLTDAAGRRYLDMYNNVASVGHGNPHVARAIAHQVQQLNTHTRYLHDAIVDYGERLLPTTGIHDARLMLTCTGSEANDVALRAARRLTGREGVIVTESAYHGNTFLVSAVSPSTNTPAPWVEVIPPPNPAIADEADLGAWWAHQVSAACGRLTERGYGVAALLVDSVFSSDGIYPTAMGTLAEASEVVHRCGGLVIADEVQPGFGRLGHSMWGHTWAGLNPDFMTTGKPMGNGMPVAAMLGRSDLLDAFLTKENYFNTFAGNPVSMAAAAAVLDEIETNDLISHTADVGTMLLRSTRTACQGSPHVGAVRGMGLYLAVDIIGPKGGSNTATAARVVNSMRDHGVLISVAGPSASTLKIRPPLIITTAQAQIFVDALKETLAALTNAH